MRRALDFIAVGRVAADRRRDEAARRAGDDAARRYADWSLVHQGLVRFAEEARSFRGLPVGAPGGPALLRVNERVFLALSGVHLLEPRESGGRVVAGVFLPGLEQPVSVDVGTLVVTDRRAVLDGSLERREWPFRNICAVHHDPDSPWSALVVSGRPETSGFFYGHADVPLVRFRLMLALAVYGGAVSRLRAELERALTGHLERKPPFP